MNDENLKLESTIKEVRSELKSILIKRREVIEKLGFAFEKVVANKESICEEIKNCLKEEIALEIISSRTIEQSCRPEWKKKTRPKLENEKFSFSHCKPEQKQRKIIIDNDGSPVQYGVENNYDDSNPQVDFKQDIKWTASQENESPQQLGGIIRELIYENKKIKQEKDEIQVKLGEAIESLHIHKQRENELLRKVESMANRSEQHQNVFDAEFPVEFRPLQSHMAQIFKSNVRQEVWFTLKIDVSKKKVVSAKIGRKLLPQNMMETGNNESQTA